MRKLIASMNITLDGYCDHTAGVVTDELHEHYNEQMRETGPQLMGRITYQLMESAWPPMVSHPTGNKPMDDFAILMNNATKIVFSRTLQHVDWKNATLAQGELTEEVMKLKQLAGESIVVGSPSLIAQLTQADLIDEYRLCIHPVVLGSGLVLFQGIQNKIGLNLVKTKTFHSGVVALYYERSGNL
ncbi:MAG: dihydrofolate reductase [Bacteroidetes bacterium]|nr:dihydrofolate reductase [Bacteroidota bacterium]